MVTNIIVFIIFILLAGGVGYYIYKNKPTEDQLKTINNFKSGIIDLITDNIAVFVEDCRKGVETYAVFDEYLLDATNNIYEYAWTFIEKEIEDEMPNEFLRKLCKKVITYDFVKETVDNVLSDKGVDIKSLFSKIFSDAHEQRMNIIDNNERIAAAYAASYEAEPLEMPKKKKQEEVNEYLPEYESDVYDPDTMERID